MWYGYTGLKHLKSVLRQLLAQAIQRQPSKCNRNHCGWCDLIQDMATLLGQCTRERALLQLAQRAQRGLLAKDLAATRTAGRRVSELPLACIVTSMITLSHMGPLPSAVWSVHGNGMGQAVDTIVAPSKAACVQQGCLHQEEYKCGLALGYLLEASCIRLYLLCTHVRAEYNSIPIR